MQSLRVSKIFSSRSLIPLTVAALVGAAPLAAEAGSKVKLRAEYQLSLAGIPLARFEMNGRFEDDGYEIDASGVSMALTSVFADFKGTSMSTGSFDGKSVTPRRYKFRMRMADSKQFVSMEFHQQKIHELEVEPELSSAPNRIPVKSAHKRDVLDPLSSVLMALPAEAISLKTACSRTIPIFDGSYRYDMVLSPKRVERMPVSGRPSQRTSVFVCQVKYVPIAGHRPGRQLTEFWANSEDIEVWLMPVRSIGSFVPYRVIIPTPIGAAMVSITDINLRGNQQRASVR